MHFEYRLSATGLESRLSKQFLDMIRQKSKKWWQIRHFLLVCRISTTQHGLDYRKLCFNNSAHCPIETRT